MNRKFWMTFSINCADRLNSHKNKQLKSTFGNGWKSAALKQNISEIA